MADTDERTSTPQAKWSRSSTIKSTKKPVEVYVPLYDVWWPNALRWHGSVLPRIYQKVLFFALFSAVVVVVQRVAKVDISIQSSIITILGLVTGLLLVFRTNTAYDRFWEGRRLWSSCTSCIRNLTRFIWVGVRGREPRDIIEKKSACNLLVAFAKASKHYLREEYGAGWKDLIEYVEHIPKYALPSSIEPLEEQEKKKKDRHASEVMKRASASNLPLEISLYISSYLQHQVDCGNIDPPLLNAMVLQLNNLCDCLTGFERILRTPIPLAYSIHLSQTVWIYTLALPFQLVSGLGWWTIPVVAVSAFTLFGIESIGGEIENPFGYDTNDLPLDDYCDVIAAEVNLITSQHPPNVDEWITGGDKVTITPVNPVAEAEKIVRKEEFPTDSQKRRNQQMTAGGNNDAAGGD